jgi:hypothetical protein
MLVDYIYKENLALASNFGGEINQAQNSVNSVFANSYFFF